MAMMDMFTMSLTIGELDRMALSCIYSFDK